MFFIRDKKLVDVKRFIFTVLNAESIGIVIALIPSALLSQILIPFADHSWAQTVQMMISLAQSLLPAIAAYAVGVALRFDMIDTGSIMLVSFISSGVTKKVPNINGDSSYVIFGSGVILNIVLSIMVAAIVTIVIKDRVKQLKMIIEPTLVLLIAGSIGLFTLPYVDAFQIWIGEIVKSATYLTPIIMGPILAIIFTILVVSPISAIGIALAISIVGIGSGAANAGVTAASFTLAWMGSTVNPLGGTLSHFLGSSKIQMANMLKHPILFLPLSIVSGIMGVIAVLLDIKGTPFSAGFGFAGLIGPLTAHRLGANWWLVILVFVIIPVILAGVTNYIFVKKYKIVKAEYLKLPLQ